MENLNLDFSRLLANCESFPAQLKESTLKYNYGVLCEILQDKEIAKFEGVPADREEIYRLTRRFGTIAAAINRKTDANPLETYNNLVREVEDQLFGHTYIYAKQWAISVKALFYYKIGQYQKAIDFSIECIALNDYLIKEGVHSLLIRSAEQNRNISRILFRTNEFEKAGCFANSLLKYLFNGEPGHLYGKFYNEKYFWSTIPYVREGYAYDCFRGYVSQMMHLNKIKNDYSSYFFDLIFGNIDIEIETPDRLIMSNWLELKRIYYSGNYEQYINEFIEFMQEPSSKQYDILKIAVCLDTERLIVNSNYILKEELLSQLLKYMLEELKMKQGMMSDLSAANLVSNEFSKETLAESNLNTTESN